MVIAFPLRLFPLALSERPGGRGGGVSIHVIIKI